MQQCENIVRLYFTPSPEPEEAGLDGKPAKKVILLEDVRLLDMCTEAAYKHLDEAPYTPQQIEETLSMPPADLFPDFPAACESIRAAAEMGLFLQVRAPCLPFWSSVRDMWDREWTSEPGWKAHDRSTAEPSTTPTRTASRTPDTADYKHS